MTGGQCEKLHVFQQRFVGSSQRQSSVHQAGLILGYEAYGVVRLATLKNGAVVAAKRNKSRFELEKKSASTNWPRIRACGHI